MQIQIKKQDMPISVYILAFGIFAIVTSEYQVTGMLPVMVQDLEVTIAQISYLISAYFLAMAIGGILLSIVLLRFNLKTTLMILYVFFVLSEILGALTSSYYTLILARIIAGATAGAFWGISMTTVMGLVQPKLIATAIAKILSGAMLGIVIGLPLASFIGDTFGWRENFWLVAILASIAALLSLYFIPTVAKTSQGSLLKQLVVFKNTKLCWVLLTSMLVLATVSVGLTFYKPILLDITKLTKTTVSSLLFGYGLATLVGVNIVAYFATQYKLLVISVGMLAFIIFFGLLLGFATSPSVAIIAVIGAGLLGATTTPALVARLVATVGNLPLVNTVHASVITFGLMLGSAVPGFFISNGFALTAALWIGIGLALLALLSLLPELWLKPSPEQGA